MTTWHLDIRDEVEALLVDARADLLAARDKDYPNETVGILCANGSVYPLINQARSTERFEVGETLVGEAINHLKYRGQYPVAVYHSHPSRGSGPSERDKMMMQDMPKAVFVIIGKDGIAAWLWDEALRFVTRIPLED